MPLSCPQCQLPLIASREQQGQVVRCPQCQTKLRLPVSKRPDLPDPIAVESVPYDEEADSEPVEVPASSESIPEIQIVQAEPVPLPPSPPARPTVPAAPIKSADPAKPGGRTAGRRFQKKEAESISRELVISMVGLGVVGILAIVGALIYRTYQASLTDPGPVENGGRVDDSEDVVRREIVMPGAATGDPRRPPANGRRTQTSPPPEMSPPRRVASSPAVRETKETEYFDGLFTDEAPTRSKSNAVKERYIYPQVSSNNQEYAKRWQQFMAVGVDHLEKRSDLPSETRLRAAKWARKVLMALAVKYDPSNRKLVTEAEQLAELDGFAEDPFVNYLHGNLLFADGETERSAALGKKAISGFESLDYPARFPVMAYVLYGDSIKANVGDQRVDWIEGFIDAIVYWFENDFRADAWEHRFVYTYLAAVVDFGDRTEIGSLQQMLDRLEQGETVPEWLRLMLKAKLFQKKAWSARGGGYASTVSDEGWKDFRKYQELSSGYYSEAIKLSPFYPEAATEMIDIARAGNTEQDFEYWFDQAVDAQFDYMPAYREMLFTLYPRWHGSVLEMVEFGAECFQGKNFDSAVPYFFLEAYHAAIQEADGPVRTLLKQDRDLQAKLLECLQGLTEKNQEIYVGFQKLDETYLPTLQAVIAERLGNFELAQEKYEEVGTGINTTALGHLQVLLKPDKLRSRSSAITGEFAPEVKRLERLMGRTLEEHEDNLIEIKSMLEKVLADNLDESSELYFRDYLHYVEAQEQFRSGDWVDLDFTSGWWESADFSQVHPIGANLVEIDNRAHGVNYRLFSKIRFPGARSIQWELEFLELGTYRTTQQNTCGLLLGSRGEAVFVGVVPLAERVVYGQLPLQNLVYVSVPSEGNRSQRKYRFRANIANGYLELFVNDHLALVVEDPALRPSQAVGIEQPVGAVGRGRTRVSNLRVRQWKAPPRSTDPQALESHYRALTSQEPDDPYHWFRLGMACHQNEKFDEAMTHYEKSIEQGMDAGEIAVFLGDLWDRKGELTKANEYYLKSVEYGKRDPAKLQNFNQQSRAALEQLNPTRSKYSVAGARYRWNLMTSSEESVRNSFEETRNAMGPVEWDSNLPWFHFKIQAQWLAQRGRFKGARFLCQKLASGLVPASQEREVRAQAKAYQLNEVFTVPDDESYRPCYLDSGDLIFFETLQKSLQRVDENVRIPELERVR